MYSQFPLFCLQCGRYDVCVEGRRLLRADAAADGYTHRYTGTTHRCIDTPQLDAPPPPADGADGQQQRRRCFVDGGQRGGRREQGGDVPLPLRGMDGLGIRV